jgi:hypothetical protein
VENIEAVEAAVLVVSEELSYLIKHYGQLYLADQADSASDDPLLDALDRDEPGLENLGREIARRSQVQKNAVARFWRDSLWNKWEGKISRDKELNPVRHLPPNSLDWRKPLGWTPGSESPKPVRGTVFSAWMDSMEPVKYPYWLWIKYPRWVQRDSLRWLKSEFWSDSIEDWGWPVLEFAGG